MLCARDAKETFVCGALETVSSCTTTPCTYREPHHFIVKPQRVPPITANAIAVAHTAWITRDDGSVNAFHFERDGEPKLEDVPWFHGALAIEATSFELYPPPPNIAVSDNIRDATQACARMPNNEIRCTMPTYSFQPTEQLTILLPSTAITVGYKFACAITATRAHAVMCWGANLQGQLGDGSRRPSDAAMLVRGLSDIGQVDAHAASACAVRADGRVACWGHTYWDEDEHDTPVWIPDLTNVAEIALGFDSLCARLKTGVITCFGKNDHQQLGSAAANEDIIGRSTIDGLSDVVKLVSIGSGTCALRADHSIVCWGDNVAPEIISFP